jgi:hypothetical protein
VLYSYSGVVERAEGAGVAFEYATAARVCARLSASARALAPVVVFDGFEQSSWLLHKGRRMNEGQNPPGDQRWSR